MKICLISSNVFPVPAVKGGACEQLVSDFIDMNELYKELDITVVSIYNEQAEEQSQRYKYTKFEYIKMEDKEKKAIDLSFDNGGRNTEFDEYLSIIKKQVDLNVFDYIVIEGGDMEAYEPLLKDCDKSKCIAHLHGTFEGTKKLEELYQYFIAVSNYVNNKVTLNGIIPKDRVFTIHNGVKTEKFDQIISDEEKVALKEQFGLGEGDIVILYCGRTVVSKGVKELLLAVKEMKNRGRVKILIVGNSNFGNEVETPYDQELYEISESIPNTVKFTGFIKNKNLYKLHNISDIAVVPTIGTEAFPLVVLEAISSGIPLITTRVGGIPEIVDNDIAIVLDKDKDLVKNLSEALDYLVEDKAAMEKLRNAGKKRAEDFNLWHYYKNFVDLFNKLDLLKK